MWTDRWTGKTISAALAEAAKRYGEREAMVFSNARLTFGDLERAADELARGFLGLGIGRGDRVAIWMAGYAEWACLYFGLLKIGAVLVPINTRYKPNELEYVLRKADVQALVFRDEAVGGKDYASLLLELCPELARATPGRLAAERLPDLRWVIGIAHRPLSGVLLYADLLRAGLGVSAQQVAEAERQVDSEAVAMIQFTSGTTAFPKGAQLFQVGMLRGAYYSAEPLGLSPDDRHFSPQPFYHAGGSISVMLSPVVSGCTAVIQAYFDATEALRTMEAERCTSTMGHQPHWIEYLNHPELASRRLHLRKAYIFASPEVNRLVAEKMDVTGLLSSYGMTETHLGGTCTRLDDPPALRLTTVGRPKPGIELEIRDPATGRRLQAGEPGEVCLRGWGLMKGYYKDPERTAEAIDEAGWFKSGDRGAVDEQGYFRLIGRIKDTVRVGGENVAAAEVEEHLLRHPKVKQTVVVGRPDARLGEVCVAFVELKAGQSATETELIDHCREGLASFKVPRYVRLIDEWPMSGTGKIQRFLLKEEAASVSADAPT
jgi:acyl-CoA synthetase (AMP-forming)/AMP-acid ligase II